MKEIIVKVFSFNGTSVTVRYFKWSCYVFLGGIVAFLLVKYNKNNITFFVTIQNFYLYLYKLRYRHCSKIYNVTKNISSYGNIFKMCDASLFLSETSL